MVAHPFRCHGCRIAPGLLRLCLGAGYHWKGETRKVSWPKQNSEKNQPCRNFQQDTGYHPVFQTVEAKRRHLVTFPKQLCSSQQTGRNKAHILGRWELKSKWSHLPCPPLPLLLISHRRLQPKSQESVNYTMVKNANYPFPMVPMDPTGNVIRVTMKTQAKPSGANMKNASQTLEQAAINLVSYSSLVIVRVYSAGQLRGLCQQRHHHLGKTQKQGTCTDTFWTLSLLLVWPTYHLGMTFFWHSKILSIAFHCTQYPSDPVLNYCLWELYLSEQQGYSFLIEPFRALGENIYSVNIPIPHYLLHSYQFITTQNTFWKLLQVASVLLKRVGHNCES